VFPAVTAPPQETGTSGSNCSFGSTTTGPSIVVPAGFTDDDPPLPVGVEIYGRKWDEPRLIEIAYGFEQGTHHRRPPRRFPSILEDAGLPPMVIDEFNARKRAAQTVAGLVAERNPEDLPADAYVDVLGDALGVPSP
jgi:hypothetical protein